MNGGSWALECHFVTLRHIRIFSYAVARRVEIIGVQLRADLLKPHDTSRRIVCQILLTLADKALTGVQGLRSLNLR